MLGVNCCYNCSGPCLALSEGMERTVVGNASRRARLAVAQAKASRAKTPQPEPEVKNAILLADHSKGKTHEVQLMRDFEQSYPELYMAVYIQDSTAEPLFAEMFAKSGCYKANSLDEADLVLFTGGADVGPGLYGELLENAHERCSFNPDRDKRDMKLYVDALKMRIPMFGVCRGAQFLHCMNKGKLYQHVDGHGQSHAMRTHDRLIIDVVSSTHHQMCVKNDRMEVLALSNKATEKWLDKRMCERGDGDDIEAFFYKDTCCLGVQGHPEYRGYTRFTNWVLEQIRDKIKHNPNVQPENAVYRVKRTIEVS